MLGEAVEHIPSISHELLMRLSRPGPRYTSYPTAPVWSNAVGAYELRHHLALANGEGPASPLSLYFHIPFCRTMCTFCGCNVVVARRQERADIYLDHLHREIELVCAHLPRRRNVAQIHLGGGTPTFLTTAQLQRLWKSIEQHFHLLSDAEVALEIDPVVTTLEQLQLLRRLGFNRISLGVQDFTPEVQQYVGRVQPVSLTRETYERARRLGFSGINFDLMYGLPKQRPDTFRRTVEIVREMAPDRIAVFAYAHVPWLRPHQRRFNEHKLPQPPVRFQLFAIAHTLFLDAGYIQVGMDHFASPYDELAQARLQCRLKRNFQGYTVNPANDLLAFGITGISDVQGCYTQNVKTLYHYYRALERGELPVERGWILSDEDRLRRRVIGDLMCNFRVDLEVVGHLFGVDARTKFASEIERLPELEQMGLLKRRDLVIELTALGRVLPRNVAMVFDSYLARSAHKQTFSHTV